jgi:hypothetical protein
LHNVKDKEIPCPINNAVCACSELFSYEDLAFHFYARILARRIMFKTFFCQIQGCDEDAEKP